MTDTLGGGGPYGLWAHGCGTYRQSHTEHSTGIGRCHRRVLSRSLHTHIHTYTGIFFLLINLLYSLIKLCALMEGGLGGFVTTAVPARTDF